MPEFIPGLQLSQRYYEALVKPILDHEFPDLNYAMAMIGSGSEILGFDTEMSTDHHWGLRLMLFLRQTDFYANHAAIKDSLSQRLPTNFLGHSTNFGPPSWSETDHGTQLPVLIEDGPVNHRVECFEVTAYFHNYLNLDITQPIDNVDWLTIPSQKLRSITSGAVYYDEIGLQSILDRFSFYPDNVWFYLMASGWNNLSQLEHLAPRAGYVGDEVGSSLIAALLVRTIMQVCFLIERQYAPYHKWFGTAFAQLDCADKMLPILRRIQLGETWQIREQHLSTAYAMLGEMHNALGITSPVDATVRPFHGRPFEVIDGWRFAMALREKISDPHLKHLAENLPIGSIDQFSSNTDLLERASIRPTLCTLYNALKPEF